MRLSSSCNLGPSLLLTSTSKSTPHPIPPPKKRKKEKKNKKTMHSVFYRTKEGQTKVSRQADADHFCCSNDHVLFPFKIHEQIKFHTQLI